VIETTDQYTRIAMIEGESTVRGGSGSGTDAGGQTLHEGEQAFIRQGAAGRPPQVQIERIPSNELGIMDDKVRWPAMAKKNRLFRGGRAQDDRRRRRDAAGHGV